MRVFPHVIANWPTAKRCGALAGIAVLVVCGVAMGAFGGFFLACDALEVLQIGLGRFTLSRLALDYILIVPPLVNCIVLCMLAVRKARTFLGYQEADPARQYSNALPIWRLTLLSVVSGGLYQHYWFYRNRQYLNEACELERSAGKETWQLSRILLNFNAIYDQFSQINCLAADTSKASSLSPRRLSYWYTILYFLMIGGSLLAFAVPSGFVRTQPVSLYWLEPAIAITGVLVIVQTTLNDIWKIRQPGLPVRQKLTGGEIVIVTNGTAVWLLVAPDILKFLGGWLPL